MGLTPRSEFSKNILTLMTGTTISQALPLAVSPILTRMYSPSDFGILALYISIITLFTPLVSARYEQAILLPQTDEDALSVFSLGLVILVFSTLALSLLFFLFGDTLIGLIGNDEIGLIIYIIPVSIFVVGLFNLLSFWSNRQKLYRDIAVSSVVKSSVLVTIQLVLGIFKFGSIGLIVGHFLAQVMAGFVLLKRAFTLNDIRQSMRVKSMSKSFKKYKRFPLYQIPHVFFTTASNNLPIYALTVFFSSTISGFYALSIRIVLSPLMVLSDASSKVYNEKIVHMIRDKVPVYSFTFGFIQSLTLKVFPVIVLISLFAPDIFAFIFSEVWREAGVYSRYLGPWLFLKVIVSTVAYIPSVCHKQAKALVISVIQFFATLIAIIIGIIFDNVIVALITFSFVGTLVGMYNLYWFLNELKTLDRCLA